MSELSLVVVIIFIGMLLVSVTVNRIPKTGRYADANGEKIVAKITNSNKSADRTATMCAEYGGKKFKVKLKDTECNLWLKGDEVEILLSDSPGKYRVLFNDYFKKNEAVIRDRVLTQAKKVDMYLISQAFTGYKKDYYEMFLDCKLETKRIFSFTTYMRMIDIYSVFTAVAAVVALLWWKLGTPSTGELIVAALLLLLMAWSVYNAVTLCKRIIKELLRSKGIEQ